MTHDRLSDILVLGGHAKPTQEEEAHVEWLMTVRICEEREKHFRAMGLDPIDNPNFAISHRTGIGGWSK